MNWKRFFDWNVGLWGIVGGVLALLTYLGIYLTAGGARFEEIDHVVIKSTIGANDQVGKSLRRLVASKGLQVTGPELPRDEQEKALDKVLKVFHRKDWDDAKKIRELIGNKAEYELEMLPLYREGSKVPKGQIQIWLAPGEP